MSQDENRRQELSNFLRTKRARISPQSVGLPAGTRRRTPGLRREEVAQLAGVSATWYTWLEQKRPIRVSGGVLENIADALKLDPVERTQLFQLALRRPAPGAGSSKEELSPLFQRLLDQIETFPAFIRGRRWDVLAWNEAARAFFLDFEAIAEADRNLVWLVFTHPTLRALLVDWPSRARDVLARFRADYESHPGDPHFERLLEKLKAASPEFARWWPRRDVLPHGEGPLEYKHSAVGRLIMENITFCVADHFEIKLTVFAPAELDSVSKLRKILKLFEASQGPEDNQL